MSLYKRTWTGKNGRTKTAWVVRWEDATGRRSKTFARKDDATRYETEVTRRRQLGQLDDLDAGKQTLNEYVRDVWIPTYAAVLAPKTQTNYRSLYALYLEPEFGEIPLREIRTAAINRWQADALKAGSGQVTVQKALTLLGSILQRAAENEELNRNPQRFVRKQRIRKTEKVKPLPPSTVEAIREAMRNPKPIEIAASIEGQRRRKAHRQPPPGTPYSRLRDATLISVMAYAGLRPNEARSLTWGKIGQTVIEPYDSKTNEWRTVRLLAPLAADLKELKLAAGRPADDQLVFPGVDADSWRSRSFDRAIRAVGIKTHPYALRHSFASLLIAEGRSIIYVARQMGHGARLTLETYGHVMDELEGVENLDAEMAIEEARSALRAR